MQDFQGLFKKNACYFCCFLIFISASAVFLGHTSKTVCFILLNLLHNAWLNKFFIVLSFIGDGLFSLALIALLFFKTRLRWLALQIFIAYLVSGLAAQVLKMLIVAPRPKLVFENSVYPFFIDGVTSTGWASFPSGHTTSVFALATLLALHLQKKVYGLFCLLAALAVGYSRIYLGQHFLQDVVAGSLLGTATAVLVYGFVLPVSRKWRLKKQARHYRLSLLIHQHLRATNGHEI